MEETTKHTVTRFQCGDQILFTKYYVVFSSARRLPPSSSTSQGGFNGGVQQSIGCLRCCLITCATNTIKSFSGIFKMPFSFYNKADNTCSLFSCS